MMKLMSEPLGFDLETADASQLFQLREEFVRLAGFTASPGVGFTASMGELIDLFKEAPYIYGHGIMTFDLLTLAYGYGMDWEAITKKAIDTELLDRLDYPPMARDTGGSIDKYDLDHVAKRRGVVGKSGSISEIAKKHGGYASIPLDDTEYRDYLAADVNAVKALMTQLPFRGNAYAKREHAIASWNGRMTLNGFRVDVPLLERRIAEGSDNKKLALQLLADDFDLPLGRFEWSGKGNDKIEEWLPFESPLSTLEGRRWLIEVWSAFGVHNPPITDTGRLSISAADLRPIAESGLVHPDLRRILSLMIEVTTTRTIYQTIQDHMVGDRVHPLIVMRQASGRSSVTSPGLTVMGKRGGRHVERDVLLPEEGQVLISADLSQVDMRGVAAHSQDRNYAKLFEPGKNVHKEHAIMIFGDEAFYAEAKAIGHGANYGQSAKTLIDKGHNPERVHTFFQRRQEEFGRLMAWTDEIRERAKSGQLLDNGFGRLMRPDPSRYYTQAPALMGQGTAADILKEAILRLPDPDFRPLAKLSVHDELLVSCDPGEVRDVQRELKKAMTFDWAPEGAEFQIPILCDVSDPGENWGVVSAK
jgi:DNA polymerase I